MYGLVQTQRQNLRHLTSYVQNAISIQKHQNPCNPYLLHQVSFMDISRELSLLSVKFYAFLMILIPIQIQQTMAGSMIMAFSCLENISIHCHKENQLPVNVWESVTPKGAHVKRVDKTVSFFVTNSINQFVKISRQLIIWVIVLQVAIQIVTQNVASQ